MKRKIKKALLFIVSGGTAAGTSLLLFYIFTNLLHIWYLIASTLSFILSVFVGFYLQKFVTFDDTTKGQSSKQMALFFMVSMINLGINIILMAIFVSGFTINQMLAKVLTLGILACWNFFVYEKFVFKKNPA